MFKQSLCMTHVQVRSLRHAVDAMSKRSAEKRLPQSNEQGKAARSAMALLSAHSEETSDAIYGGDEAAVYEARVRAIDMYRLCATP